MNVIITSGVLSPVSPLNEEQREYCDNLLPLRHCKHESTLNHELNLKISNIRDQNKS